ncbi:Pimeloyl-ACP methyl ester carboxylesterase [Sphingomonas laterariae]|uniref:Pimeloyl-ACP methyl ester carboxylesterase n=1 Tax=Edaphosphingomonas laterariae TaxID=861865 RepID=A0A239CX07_9SPHN|nr:alpha/beta hydrolase [Sphingomonas laterariae]SNS24171.1 Pimeloyl-ACP methyl ester carboxylesterase [Sphingomonas laterariae]
MPVIGIGQNELYYEDQGEGPAIVLAHGIGGNHASWYQQVPVFARSYRVVSFDHRGFGRSTDVENAGRTAFAGDLLALLDHLGIEQAVLVGQSMGAGTCISFAAAHPDRVRALVIASSLHAIAEGEDVAPLMDAARAATADLAQLDRVLDADFRAANPVQAALYSAIASFNRVDRKTLAGDWPARIAPEAVGNGAPLLFLAGSADILFPVEAVRRTQARVPNSYLVEVDAGHSVFFERPGEFNDSVLSFLAACGIRGVRRSAHSNAAGYTAPTN